MNEEQWKQIENAEIRKILEDDLESWHKDALVDLLLFIRTNYPKQYVDYYMANDEMLRGN